MNYPQLPVKLGDLLDRLGRFWCPSRKKLVQQLRAQLESYEGDGRALLARFEPLEALSAQQSHEVQRLREQVAAQHDRIAQLNAQIGLQQDDNAQLQNETLLAGQQIGALQAALAERAAELEANSLRLDAAGEDIRRWQELSAVQSDHLEQLRQRDHDQLGRISEQSQQMERQATEQTRLSGRLADAEGQIDELQALIRRQVDQLEAKRRDLAESHDATRRWEKLADDQTNDLVSLREQNRQQRQRIRQQDEELERQRTAYAQLQDERCSAEGRIAELEARLGPSASAAAPAVTKKAHGPKDRKASAGKSAQGPTE